MQEVREYLSRYCTFSGTYMKPLKKFFFLGRGPVSFS